MKPSTLSDFTGDVKSSGSQLCFKTCPVCGSDGWKLYVNPETGMWYCFAGQHAGGGCVDVGMEANTYDEGRKILGMLASARQREELTEVELPPFHPLSGRALRYMGTRGFSEDVCRRHGIVEWEDKYRILIPYWNDKGALVYWNSRSYSDNLAEGPKYIAAPGRHPLYIPQLAPGAAVHSAVIVEGALDAIAVAEACPGHLPIALGGKTLPKYLRRDLTEALTYGMIKLRVKIFLDHDALSEALTLRSRLGGSVIVRPGDPAEYLAEDPELLREVVDAAE